jgi:hypothetical protein
MTAIIWFYSPEHARKELDAISVLPTKRLVQALTRTRPTVSLRAGIIAFVAENEP